MAKPPLCYDYLNQTVKSLLGNTHSKSFKRGNPYIAYTLIIMVMLFIVNTFL